MSETPKISFCTLVLNGIPFLIYHYRMLYPHVHQLIYVEGSCPNAINNAREDGHSRDGTLEKLYELKQHHDPDNKVTIIKAEDTGHPNGTWPGDKDEMSKAFESQITGNWLWCGGIDEFYHQSDIETIKNNILKPRKYDVVNITMLQFWGGIEYISNGFRFHQLGDDTWGRIYKWANGYTHATHRPITVLDENGVDLVTKNVLHGKELTKNNIYFYHYSYILPLQVEEKCLYYSKMSWGFSKMQQWAENNFFKLGHPFRIDSCYLYPSWLERFNGRHPSIILEMWDDIKKDDNIRVRQTDDIELLLNSKCYYLSCLLLKNFPIFLIRLTETIARTTVRAGRKIHSILTS